MRRNRASRPKRTLSTIRSASPSPHPWCERKPVGNQRVQSTTPIAEKGERRGNGRWAPSSREMCSNNSLFYSLSRLTQVQSLPHTTVYRCHQMAASPPDARATDSAPTAKQLGALRSRACAEPRKTQHRAKRAHRAIARDACNITSNLIRLCVSRLTCRHELKMTRSGVRFQKRLHRPAFAVMMNPA